MMMNQLLALVALSATAVSAKGSPKMKRDLQNMQRDGLKADSPLGRQLINKSRRVEQGGYEQKDISFISSYSIKFMGCHHVTQWASEEEQEQQEDADDAYEGEGENVALDAANGRIRSKGLVRFRLCPAGTCSDHFTVGCSSNYGEYVVDMTNFLEIYIAYKMEEEEYKCEKYSSTCQQKCYQSATANCYSSCYKKHGVNAALCSKNGNNGNNYADADAYSTYDAYAEGGYGEEFDLDQYLGCGEYVINNGEEDIAHYLGPYCDKQGGDVKLGFFQDEYCSIESTYQASYYEKMTGVEVPYTQTSLISQECMSCEQNEDLNDEAQNNQDYYNYDADGNANYYIAKEVNEVCSSLYMTSGKCETTFGEEDVPYPEEGACGYIAGVKKLQTDGIIRSNQTMSSKPASVAIGLFTGMAVLLGGYVYYLKSKIQRSRVNLAGASTSLA